MRSISHWGQFEIDFDWLDNDKLDSGKPYYFPDDPFGPVRGLASYDRLYHQ